MCIHCIQQLHFLSWLSADYQHLSTDIKCYQTLLLTTTNVIMLNDRQLICLKFTVFHIQPGSAHNQPDVNIKSTHQSRLGLIYTAWDALWCVWSWSHRSHSTMRTDRSRSKLNICTVDL